MKRPSLINAIKKRTAVVAVGPSDARGQGTSGVVKALREALDCVPLAAFATSEQQKFEQALDRWTSKVRAGLPEKAQSWGLARKCLNCFLRDCFYNIYLVNHWGLACAEGLFEVPLDSIVAKRIREEEEKAGKSLPPWPGLKHLTPEVSKLYQRAALVQSEARHLSRVHLDTYLWVPPSWARKASSHDAQASRRRDVRGVLPHV